jgi:hypothetical protein
MRAVNFCHQLGRDTEIAQNVKIVQGRIQDFQIGGWGGCNLWKRAHKGAAPARANAEGAKLRAGIWKSIPLFAKKKEVVVLSERIQ